MEYNKDMFGQMAQDQEQINKRAEDIWDIYCERFDVYGSFRYAHIYQYQDGEVVVEIEAIEYGRCGYPDETSFVEFPAEILLKDDEGIHNYFKEKKQRIAEQERIKHEREEAERKKRHEEYERKMLVELIKKYGIPELPENNG